MIKIELTGEEKLQFQYILPMRGSLVALELVASILKKVNENVVNINFEDDEFSLIVEMIAILDSRKELPFSALSLIKKILNISKKGEA